MSPLLPPFRWVWLLSIAAGLSACSILPASLPQDIYRLPPSSIGVSQGEPADTSLRINRPFAMDLLSSTRIVVVPEGNRISVYQGARWSSPAPVLWREHLLDAFHNDGRVTQLSSSAARLPAEVELGGVLRAFQVEYGAGEAEVVIRLDAHLVNTASKQTIASRRFSVKEEVNGDQVPAVVEAFGRANDALAREIINWTLQYVK